jgi:chromosome segregation ATPase
MSNEPQLKDVSEDDNRPATKGDVSELVQISGRSFGAVEEHFQRVEQQLDSTQDRLDSVDERLSRVDQRLNGVDERLERLERGQEAMLGILNENNQLLGEIRRLPQRVERLERSVFRR